MALMVFKLYLMAMLSLGGVADDGGDGVDDTDDVLLMMTMLVAMLMACDNGNDHNSDNDQ
jgi:hypothetical protein